MTVRAAVLSLTLALVSAAPALAQPAGPTGSLTLMSRPAGAWFRLEGDVAVVGRTPMTLNRGLTGRFRISGSEIGYQRWSRTVELDGVTADTVWIALRQKSGLMAGVRSLVLPGWGQFYDDHRVRGTVFLISGIAVGAGVGVSELIYRDRQDEVEAADAAYVANQTPETLAARDRAVSRADDVRQVRGILLGAAAGVVVLSVIDAAVSVPRPVGTILLGAARRSLDSGFAGVTTGGPRFALTLAEVRF